MPRKPVGAGPRARPKRVTQNIVNDYRHDDKRKNNPEAGLASYETVPTPTLPVNGEGDKEVPPLTGGFRGAVRQYSYDPHLDPQLIWSGKAEHTSFEVDTVNLHIHERVSTQAIINAVRRVNGPTGKQLALFADPQLPLAEAVEFYQHDVAWANRLILGDSLLVMNSLLERELMAGKVQMIYMDPPYGVSYSSNFQPRTDRRDVKDGDDGSLTREPEQIRAYRDTWKLGVHSYLTYLRDRLLLCRELLHESGSIFVQISDENLHLVRSLLDEVFGRENFVAIIPFRKTAARAARLLDLTNDYLLWYARSKDTIKYRGLYQDKAGRPAERQYSLAELPDGTIRRIASADEALPEAARQLMADQLLSPGATATGVFSIEFAGKRYQPAAGYHWKTTEEGLQRLSRANRLIPVGSWLKYKRYLLDFGVVPLTESWLDTVPST